RGHWQGVRAGLRASFREGLLVYAPFWIPRIPYQLGRAVLGLPVSRRLLWRRVHEGLQPPRIPADRTNSVPSDATAPAPELQESRR
ncbi:MAG TPA: hypothetical protein VFH14_08580, partial [Gemmatimonadaceae bacterium]|nr:hypothetical protein [Gemmatimonadaceae bacterium]